MPRFKNKSLSNEYYLVCVDEIQQFYSAQITHAIIPLEKI